MAVDAEAVDDGYRVAVVLILPADLKGAKVGFNLWVLGGQLLGYAIWLTLGSPLL